MNKQRVYEMGRNKKKKVVLGSRYHSNNLLISNLKPGKWCYILQGERWHYRKIVEQERNEDKTFKMKKCYVSVRWTGELVEIDSIYRITRLT